MTFERQAMKYRNPFSLVLGLIVIGFSINALAASFDCGKAKSNVEKSICGNPRLSKLDEDLSASYRSALKNFPVKGFIKSEQRDWLSLVRWTQCKTECSNELIKEYSKRIEQLTLPAGARIYSNTREFVYENGDAVIQFVPSGEGMRMRVWGGFAIHRQASEDAGKPIYVGCEFDGIVKGNTAVEGETKVVFKVTDDELEFSAEPEICLSVRGLPDTFFRVQ